MLTKELTKGERLLLDRRRLQMTQMQYAKLLGVPLGSYKRAERDEGTGRWEIPDPALRRIEPREACLVKRRRSGKTIDEIAQEIKRSKWWVCLMERGKAPDASLREYWGE